MINFYDAFKTEDDFEINGTWKEYKGMVRVKIARAGNKNTTFNEEFRKASKKYKNAGTDTKKDIDTPWVDVFVNSIIKGFEVKKDGEWVSGVYLPNDEGVVELKEATKQNIFTVLVDLPDLFKLIREDAEDMQTFQKEKEEEEVKN